MTTSKENVRLLHDQWHNPETTWDVVLGGGGIKGFAHCGFLKSVEENRLRLGTVYGVSIGAACAALYTNGYSARELSQILQREIASFDKSELTRFLRCPHPVRIWRDGGFFDLHALFEKLIRKYELKPNDSLSIVSYAPKLRKPVVFRGTDYDLCQALTASCALPLFMRTTSMQIGGVQRRLIDGGLYHPNSDEFCKRPALVSALGMARRLPSASLSFTDWLLHLCEMIAVPIKGIFQRRGYKPTTLFVQSGMHSVATMTFSLDRNACQQLEDFGYRATARAFAQAAGQ